MTNFYTNPIFELERRLGYVPLYNLIERGMTPIRRFQGNRNPFAGSPAIEKANQRKERFGTNNWWMSKHRRDRYDK